MSDIFDEVDEILSDVEMSSDVDAATETESNFNEAELQDIMSEIENLEKELDAEPVVAAEPIVVPVKKPNLQDQIDYEIEMAQAAIKVVEHAVEAKETIAETPTVLSFEKNSEPALQSSAINTSSSEISFEGHGQMNLNLDFKIGEESAKLTIDSVKGLVVTMNGVELCISQEGGCIVKMENGVNFTIPLTSSAPPSKKKSA